MFRRSSEPVLPSQAALQGLRASLNAPVVRVEGLPVAAARAAIVLYDTGYGELSLAVGLRSREPVGPMFFVHQEPIPLDQPIAHALDIGVAFAEGMGFLFDEDPIAAEGASGRARAAAVWDEIVGVGAASPTGDRVAFDGDLSLADEAIDLDEDLVLDEAIDLAEEIPAAAPGAAESIQGVARPTLTKFRGPAVADGQVNAIEPQNAAGSQLGRVPIVRRRASGDERPSRLIRLLGTF